MASFSAISSHCSGLIRHGRTSPLSPRFQLPSPPSPLNSSSSSLSTSGIRRSRSPIVLRFEFSRFGSPRLPLERKCAVQTAGVRQLTGSLTRASGLRFAVVVGRFNEIVTRPLLEGALDTFRRYSVNEEDIDVVWVPGCFEIGVVSQSLGKSGKYHAVLCIGAVIKGDTSHYDAVVNSASSGVLSAGLNSGVPCIFGVLTCDNMDQALDRAGGKAGNKGSETALTAIEMASLYEHHLKL